MVAAAVRAPNQMTNGFKHKSRRQKLLEIRNELTNIEIIAVVVTIRSNTNLQLQMICQRRRTLTLSLRRREIEHLLGQLGALLTERRLGVRLHPSGARVALGQVLQRVGGFLRRTAINCRENEKITKNE